jgi:hypothetical protein
MILGAAMYVIVVMLNYRLDGDDIVNVNLLVAGAWNLLLFVATVIAIIDAIRTARAKRTSGLATNAMVVKLVSIPFFILNYLVLALVLIVGTGMIIFGGAALWIVVAIGSVLTYLTTLSTSVYVWAAIAQLRRERIIGTGLTVLYGILSLIFVADIAAGVMVFGHYRRRPRLTLVVLLLSCGLLTLAFGVTGLFIFGPTLDYDSNPFGLPAYGLVIVGIAVILPTGIVALVRRPALRNEAQRAVVLRLATSQSDTTDRELVV